MSLKYVGWVKNLSHEAISVPTHTPELTKESAAKLKDYYLYQIEKEYSKTFNDKERERLRHFRNIIDGLNENANSSNFSFGTDYYEYIFEYMINRFFGGINISKKYQPKSYWKFKDNTVCEGSSLMPDTIVEYNSDKLLIIDAKYYRFGSLDKKIRDRHLPPTSSVHKQIVYGEHNSKNDEGQEAYNIFVMPYNKEKKLFNENKDDLIYIGYAQMDKDNETENQSTHKRVHTFLIDLKYLIKNYKNDNQKTLDAIVKEITKLP